jgi:hypothetical protein
VYNAVQALDNYKCVDMEDFGARDSEPDEFCRRTVGRCDVFVGIVGLLYGANPPGLDESFTEREYQTAVDLGKPRLMFLAPEDFPLPGNLTEDDVRRQKQQAFRTRVNTARVRASFKSPDHLATAVVAALHNLEQVDSSSVALPTVQELIKYSGPHYRRIMRKARQFEVLESKKIIWDSQED